MADAMVRLARDPALRSRLGAGGLSVVRGRYDWDVLAGRLLDIYDQVCGSSRPNGLRTSGTGPENTP
jgi:glycosyltransferase involved in cell wall biosynthesis